MGNCKLCNKKRDMSQTVLSGHTDLCNDCGLEEIDVYKVYYEDFGNFIHSEIDDALSGMKAEIENAEDASDISMTLTMDKMTRSEYLSLSEYEG